ncbi:MAG TPA: hypothetical protein VNU45_13845 [Rummeliibacillus sp.]|nr:hypothetical protein [Rummeliibacillus sp.]
MTYSLEAIASPIQSTAFTTEYKHLGLKAGSNNAKIHREDVLSDSILRK